MWFATIKVFFVLCLYDCIIISIIGLWEVFKDVIGPDFLKGSSYNYLLCASLPLRGMYTYLLLVCLTIIASVEGIYEEEAEARLNNLMEHDMPYQLSANSLKKQL